MFGLLDENNILIQKQPNEQEGFVSVPGDAVCGQVMQSDGSFVNPPTPIDELKIIAKLRITKDRDEAVDAGVTYDGNAYDSYRNSRDNLAGVYTGINNGYVLPAGFAWRTSDDITVPFDVAAVNGLSHVMLNHVNFQYGKSWNLKAQIDAATDQAEIDAIVW